MTTNFNPSTRASAEHTALVEKLVREHQIAHDKFTEQQMADLILQMLASGDIIRHVRASDGAQAVVYIPYAETERHLSRIKFLESILKERGINPDVHEEDEL